VIEGDCVLSFSVNSVYTACRFLSSFTREIIEIRCCCVLAAAVVYDNFLLFVDGPQGKLFQMALNGTTVLELPASSKPQNPVAVDFDPVTQTVYWTDIESRTIRRAAINGSNREIFLQLQPGEFRRQRKAVITIAIRLRYDYDMTTIRLRRIARACFHSTRAKNEHVNFSS